MLAAGELERQPLQQRGAQPVVAQRRRRTRLGQLAVAALGQRPLQADGLVEAQPLQRALALDRRSRRDAPRAAPRPRTSDRVRAECFPAADRRPDRARRAPGVRRRRCPSSAVWRWPGRSGRSRARTPRGRTRRRRPAVASTIFFNDLVPPPVRPVGESRIRNAGWVSCMVPLKKPTSPDSITRVPLTRVCLMYLALKKVAVTFGRRCPSVMTRYSVAGPVGERRLGLGDGVDEGDVLAFLRRLVALAEHRRALAVLARVVPQQVVDGADAEHLVERVRRPSSRR